MTTLLMDDVVDVDFFFFAPTPQQQHKQAFILLLSLEQYEFVLDVLLAIFVLFSWFGAAASQSRLDKSTIVRQSSRMLRRDSDEVD